jgi:phage tail sheath protein FI
MPEYLHPGVYIEEIERGPRPIEGVATSTAAFLGETERGPTRPRMVTSYTEYRRWFGGVFGSDKYMPYAISGFFDNGGKRVFVCRIVTSPAATANGAFNDLAVQAVGPGVWGNNVFVEIKNSTTTIPDPNNPGSANPAKRLHPLQSLRPGQQQQVAAPGAGRRLRRSVARRSLTRLFRQAGQR